MGFDIGSSSVKAALLDIATGKPAAMAFSPSMEMAIASPAPGFAEQDPDTWWRELLNAVGLLRRNVNFTGHDIAGIGISYQMHGLVCVDKDLAPLRPSIIWCDSRAVDTGNKAFDELGHSFCLEHLLNSPGNFTASKLRWVQQHEPRLYEKIYKVMLPGDYIALRLTGEATTTASGLSEGIFWDFPGNSVSSELLRYYDIDQRLLSSQVPTFGVQGKLNASAASALGLAPGIPVSYRAGDQPNNAFSLNVLEPGEIAATAGTSGVVYGVTDRPAYDPQSRVNSFVHVNHTDSHNRYGVLLCVNGTGILNSWLRRNFFGNASYEDMNREAEQVAPGADGLSFYPFGNGAERVLENRDTGAWMKGLQFNRHHRGHIARAAQEGIVFALCYGMEVMQQMGLQLHTVRAGYANMFLSPVFADTFAAVSGCHLQLYNTDGALGAARAAGVGAGVFGSFGECFRGMELVKQVEPGQAQQQQLTAAYQQWKQHLSSNIA